jgi:hypothetical protein
MSGRKRKHERKRDAASEVDMLDSRGNRDPPKHSRAVRAWEASVNWAARRIVRRDKESASGSTRAEEE